MRLLIACLLSVTPTAARAVNGDFGSRTVPVSKMLRNAGLGAFVPSNHRRSPSEPQRIWERWNEENRHRFETALPSVVTVVPPKGPATRQQGMGTGFVVEGGLIVTNNHVVEAAAAAGRVDILRHDGETFHGRVIFTDPGVDVALIALDPAPIPAWPELKLSDSTTLREGDRVFALGSPFGLVNSYSAGQVSAIRAGNAEFPGGAVQADAAINPGNSGGPLLDGNGDVVGMNTAGATETNSGVGFAVPSNTILDVIARYRSR